MANYRTNLSQDYGPCVGYGGHRAVTVLLCGVITVTTGMIDNANDEIELGWVPAGATITGIEFRGTDMDTNGSPALAWDVGDADDEDRLLAAVTVGQSAARTDALAATGFLYKYTAKTRIKAYVQTAAATGAAGTLYFMIFGFCDPENTAATALTASST